MKSYKVCSGWLAARCTGKKSLPASPNSLDRAKMGVVRVNCGCGQKFSRVLHTRLYFWPPQPWICSYAYVMNNCLLHIVIHNNNIIMHRQLLFPVLQMSVIGWCFGPLADIHYMHIIIMQYILTMYTLVAERLERIIVHPTHYQARCTCARHYCVFVTLVLYITSWV